MKAIKILLVLFSLVSFVQVHAQDEIYNNKKKKESIKAVQKTETSLVSIEEYTTEQDFNKKHNISTSYEVFDEYEEIYEEEKDMKRRRNNNIAGEIIAEVFVEVLVNTVFIIAAFWH